jgi:predicted aspartyl protease
MLKYDDMPFTTGRVTFYDQLPGFEEPTPKIYLRIMASPLTQEIVVQLDTGAPWLVLDPEIAAAVGLMGGQGESQTLDTRWGRKHGRLERTSIILVADEGDSLEIEATAFVCQDWHEGRNFLGYTGVLERLKFAIDPTTNSFFFGAAT